MSSSSQKQQFLLYRVRVFKDPAAFAQIYEEHKTTIRRYLGAKLPSVQDADDALSTTFVRAWSYFQTTKVDHAEALLVTIARNVIAEFYRMRRQTISYDAETETGETLSDDGHGKAQIEKQSDAALARELIAELPEEQALAVSLRYFSGLSIGEVATHIGKTSNATAVLLHRALKTLKEKLNPKSSTEDPRS